MAYVQVIKTKSERCLNVVENLNKNEVENAK